MGEITFTIWDKQDLIQSITTDPRILLASDAHGAFLMLIGQIDEGKVTDQPVRKRSKRSHAY